MKFDIELIKKWSYESNTNNIIKYFISMGFESFIDKKKIDISIPYDKKNFSNLFHILGNFLNLHYLKTFYVKNNFSNNINIELKCPDFCPIFYGIIIKNINQNIKTPNFIKQNLLDNNLTFTNNIIIDIVNYTTLITGQPLHAYDLKNLNSIIKIEKINNNEKIITLNSNVINLNFGTPIIRDSKNIISLPGIIGCHNTMITEKTKDIFLESAFFNNKIINNLSLKYNIKTSSSLIFSNIVDTKFSKFSLIYSSFLFKLLTGSESSNIIEKSVNSKIFNDFLLIINKEKTEKLIGSKICNHLFLKCFKKIGFFFKICKKYIKVNIPFYRTDINNEDSFISEFIKIYEYKNIPCHSLKSFSLLNFYEHKSNSILNFLVNHGFYEIITYTFVDSKFEKILHPKECLVYIKNPMSEKMNVLRFSILQGLLKTIKNNLNRGNENLAFFEIGNVFLKQEHVIEKNFLTGVCSEQFILTNFGFKKEKCFFFIKNIIKNICNLFFPKKEINFLKNNYKYSNKNLNLSILINDLLIGDFCLINNEVLNFFDIKQNLYFFQIHLKEFDSDEKIFYKKISKYQKIKRDLSLILENEILYKSIDNFIKELKINVLKNLFLLDIYLLNNNKKSLTIRIILQSLIKTLSDDEIKFIFTFLKEKIKTRFNAIIKN